MPVNPGDTGNGALLDHVLDSLADDALPAADPPQQVRIEQHFSIRISPGGPMLPPDVLLDAQPDDFAPHYVEHAMGRCVAMAGIAAVQGGEGNRLLLFMRDQHIVSAILEKACAARDFYSGFYVMSNTDGMLCVDRDTLQARSGANCKLRRLRALIEAGDR